MNARGFLDIPAFFSLLFSRSDKMLSYAAFTSKKVTAGCFFLFWAFLVLMTRPAILSVVALFFSESRLDRWEYLFLLDQ